MDALVKLDRVVSLMRQMDPIMPTQVISVFLAIAKSKEPLETRLLPNKVGLSQSAVNRALTYLQDTHWKDHTKPGLKLIAYRPHHLDARQRLASLSPRGQQLVAQIKEIIDG